MAFYDWEKVEPVQTVKLSLRHTYIPKTAGDFAGPGSFGGRDDELVLCAGKCELCFALTTIHRAEETRELGIFIYGTVNPRHTYTTSGRSLWVAT